jgi:hypothetical protein
VGRSSRRAQIGLVLAGVVIIAAGFGVALVEMYHWPKGSIWGVVAAAVVLVAIIRVLSARRR